MARLAIVATLRNAEDVLHSFVAYHRAIGFERLYLFFDDPHDPALATAQQLEGVTVVAHDAALRAAWRAQPQYQEHQAYVDVEVMSRQTLNVSVAMSMARAEGYDWLLGIDADELFWPAATPAQAQFEALGKAGAEAVRFGNMEAIPEQDEIGDYFREVSLFKLADNARRQDFETALAYAQTHIPQVQPYFQFYMNGKSAVRLSAEGVEAFNVHRFHHRERSIKEALSQSQFVLHYACCGFEHFWTKYRTLGAFSNAWWGERDIAASIGTFHLEARDIVMTGDRARALAFYRERLAVTDGNRARELIDLGLAVRVQAPRRLLERETP